MPHEQLEMAILVGLPASGKSSFYRLRLSATHVQVSKDLFPSARNKAARQHRDVETALVSGRNVAVDNTNVTRAQRTELLEQARRFGARVVCYWFETSPQECLARNAGRSGKARVPEVAIWAAFKRMEAPGADEGFDSLCRVQLAAEGGFLVTKS